MGPVDPTKISRRAVAFRGTVPGEAQRALVASDARAAETPARRRTIRVPVETVREIARGYAAGDRVRDVASACSVSVSTVYRIMKELRSIHPTGRLDQSASACDNKP